MKWDHLYLFSVLGLCSVAVTYSAQKSDVCEQSNKKQRIENVIQQTSTPEQREQFWQAMLSDDVDRVIRHLEQYPQDIHLEHSDSLEHKIITPLMFAIENNAFSSFKAILDKTPDQFIDERDMDPEEPDELHNSSLFYAAENHNPAFAQALIDRGATVDLQNSYGQTPFLYASRWNNISVLRLLLRHGANPNNEELDGNNAISTLLEENENPIETLTFLIEHGVNINKPNNAHQTPLMIAALLGLYDAVVILVEHGAKLTEINDQNLSAYDLAKNKLDALKSKPDITPDEKKQLLKYQMIVQYLDNPLEYSPSRHKLVEQELSTRQGFPKKITNIIGEYLIGPYYQEETP